LQPIADRAKEVPTSEAPDLGKSQMTFDEFRGQLMKRCEELSRCLDARDDPEIRPFVCRGKPLASEIFIVGENPATKMEKSIWDSSFWNDDKFDYAAWEKEYQEARGRLNKDLMSPTRTRIVQIVKAASPRTVLETNVFAVPTDSEEDLTPQFHKNLV
jgi:hypothetical protein